MIGGDFIFAEGLPQTGEKEEEGCVLAIIDCTRRGVPDTFISLIASFGLKKIIRSEGWRDPALILNRLTFWIRTALQQDSGDMFSDDGLNVAICFVSGQGADHDRDGQQTILTFAGARLPLYCAYNGEITVIRGDRQSIGYKLSDLNSKFTNHRIPVKEGMSFYMATNGLADQLGGEEHCRFDNRRLKNLLKEIADIPFEKQQAMLLESFNACKGENETRDDVTMVGFRIPV